MAPFALAVGMGQSPLDENELRYVTEDGLTTLLSLATVIVFDDTWLAEVGLDLPRVVHGEQRITLHKPLPPEGRVGSTIKILDVFDKGPGRGAILYVRTRIADKNDGTALATMHSKVMARGDGGFGGPRGRPPRFSVFPSTLRTGRSP